jgi:hypothetical protein
MTGLSKRKSNQRDDGCGRDFEEWAVVAGFNREKYDIHDEKYVGY